MTSPGRTNNAPCHRAANSLSKVCDEVKMLEGQKIYSDWSSAGASDSMNIAR